MPTPKAEKAEKKTKPRKTPAKKTPAAPEPVANNNHHPTHDQIAVLAHQFWAERGFTHGQHEQDWLRAEQELLKTAS